jgi:hypothetical protein
VIWPNDRLGAHTRRILNGLRPLTPWPDSD